MKKKKKKCRSHHKLNFPRIFQMNCRGPEAGLTATHSNQPRRKKVHVRTGFAIILASNLMLNPVFPREFHKQKVVVLGW